MHTINLWYYFSLYIKAITDCMIFWYFAAFVFPRLVHASFCVWCKMHCQFYKRWMWGERFFFQCIKLWSLIFSNMLLCSVIAWKEKYNGKNVARENIETCMLGGGSVFKRWNWFQSSSFNEAQNESNKNFPLCSSFVMYKYIFNIEFSKLTNDQKI